MSPVVKVTTDQVRAAIDRLLTGRSIHTDGSLTIENLALEATTSRQTLYRAHGGLLDEFRTHAARIAEAGELVDERAVRELRLREQIAAAEARSLQHRSEAQHWKLKAEQLASQVAFLAAQNEVLRTQQPNKVRPLPVTRRSPKSRNGP